MTPLPRGWSIRHRRTFLAVFSNGGYHENRRSLDRTACHPGFRGHDLHLDPNRNPGFLTGRILSGDHAHPRLSQNVPAYRNRAQISLVSIANILKPTPILVRQSFRKTAPRRVPGLSSQPLNY